MLRSVIRSPVRTVIGSVLTGDTSLLSEAQDYLGGVEPYHWWDFINNRAIFARQDVGALAGTPGWSFARASVGTAENAAGQIIQFASGELRRTDKGVLIEGARTNLFLNSATGATQDVAVTAAAHTLSFRGTGTITLSGASTAGPLAGTGANNRVTLTFTPSAGTLTLTVSGSCTNVQLELGGFASSWIPTTGSTVTRAADALTISSPGVDYPLSLFAEYERTVDTGAAEVVLQVDETTNAERATLRTDQNDLAGGLMTDGGVSQAAIAVAGVVAIGTPTKVAARFAANDVQASKGGTLGTADTSASLPTTPTVIRFGTGSGANPCFSYLRKVAIFNSALNDAALQAVTA